MVDKPWQIKMQGSPLFHNHATMIRILLGDCNCNGFKYLSVYIKYKKIGGGHTWNVLEHIPLPHWNTINLSITVVPEDSAYLPLIVK